ncbi:MAG: hypothetical protein ACLP5H_20125 [Desulfomonilaceae bacterium]
MEQKIKGTKVTEVIGGIGWIFGMVSIRSYFTSRKRTEKSNLAGLNEQWT